MKKLVLVAAAALTCSGLVSAQSSTVSVYARVDNGVRTFSGNAGGQSADLYHSALGGSRWGLSGSHDLGGGMKAGAVLEGQILSDIGGIGNSTRLFDRQSFIYFSEEKWGTVKLGRDNTFGLDALFSGALDVAGLLDAAKSNPTKITTTGTSTVDAYGPNPLTSVYSTARNTRRLDNAVKYTNTAGNFNYGLGYAFGETDGDLKAGKTQNVILGYKKDKLTAVTTYQVTNDPTNTNRKMDIWNIGGRYNFGKVSAVAAYHVMSADAGYNPLSNTTYDPYFQYVLTGKDADATTKEGKVNISNIGMAYNFKPQWTYTLSYYNVDQKEGVKVGKVDSVITHLQYDMNKFVSLYGIVDYQKAKGGLKTTTAGASGDQLAFTAGLRVMFDASKSF